MPKPIKQAAIVLLALLCLLAGYGVSQVQAQGRYNNLLDTYESQLTEAEVVKNRARSLEGAIALLETDNQDLQSLIAEIVTHPAEIRYITKTETVIKASDPVFITPDLPEEHLFILDPGLTVARFAQVEDQFSFETYDMSFRNTMIIAENKTSVSLQVATSFDNQWHEIPIEVEVVRIRHQRLFEPHLGAGITGGIPTWDVTGTVFVSLLHPLEDVDALSLRIGANSQVATLGIDPVGYNIGAPLPVLTDLWVWAGPSINTRGELGVDLTIGSKF